MTTHTLPIVHMNGTSLEELTRGYDAIDDALESLKDAMSQLEFNARDYYLGGPEYWEKARDERLEVNGHVRAIMEWVGAHRSHLYSIKMERSL
jgi:hypothetical protein